MDPNERTVPRREAMIRLLRLGGIGAGAGMLGLWLTERGKRPAVQVPLTGHRNFQVPGNSDLPEMVVVQGHDPRLLARRAVDELGGIRRFISKGDVVAIKPNAAWNRTPEQAANTNPLLVGEACRLCWEAGARRVMVADASINNPLHSFARSGIGEAVRAAGAEVILPSPDRFRAADLGGRVLNVWPVLDPFLTADKVINIPVAKNHSLCRVSLGMKNWYGILDGQRQRLHQRIHESIADLADFMRPTLTLIDAFRVLVRNGPDGGNTRDVELRQTLIAGTDPVALDAYAAKAYWDLDWQELPYLRLAAERGLGKWDLGAVPTRFVTL